VQRDHTLFEPVTGVVPHRDVRAAEAVDGLLGVADDEHLARGQSTSHRRRPQASIYGFRGADISGGTTPVTGSTACGHAAPELPHGSPIVAWVNEVFDAVDREGRRGSQPAYSELAAKRGEWQRGSRDPRRRPAPASINQLRAEEADEVARLVALAKAEGWTVDDQRAPDGSRPIRYDDIALLLPTARRSGHIERALDANAVPYRVESRSLVWSTESCASCWPCWAPSTTPPTTSRSSPHYDTGLRLFRRRPRHLAIGGRRLGPPPPHPDGIDAGHPVARAMTGTARLPPRRNDGPVDVLIERVIRSGQLVELAFRTARPRDHWRRLRFVLDQSACVLRRVAARSGSRGLGCAADGRRRNGRRDTRARDGTTTPYASSRSTGPKASSSRWWCWPGSARGNATWAGHRGWRPTASRCRSAQGQPVSRRAGRPRPQARVTRLATRGTGFLYVAARGPATTSWSVCHIPTASTLATATHRSCGPLPETTTGRSLTWFAAFRSATTGARRRRRSRAGVGARECRGARHVACGARRADRVDAGAAGAVGYRHRGAGARAVAHRWRRRGSRRWSTPMPMSMSTRSSASTFRRSDEPSPRRRRSVGAALPRSGRARRAAVGRPRHAGDLSCAGHAVRRHEASASEPRKSRVWRSQRSMRRSSGRLGDPHAVARGHRRRASAGRPVVEGYVDLPVRGRRRPADRRRLQDRRGRRPPELDAAVERYGCSSRRTPSPWPAPPAGRRPRRARVRTRRRPAVEPRGFPTSRGRQGGRGAGHGLISRPRRACRVGGGAQLG